MKETESVIIMENCKETLGLHFTINHQGKMKGMSSLSTSPLCNKYCAAYAQDETKICSHCYAQRQMKMYPSMRKCLKQNTDILCNSVIPIDSLPIINRAFFRFESFGDLNNCNQVINYFNICKKNKYTHFALWTKNPNLIKHVLDTGEKKPENLQIILSSHYLNTPADISKWGFVDKIFTVYDAEYIAKHNIEINCGAKSCLTCNKCYRKTKEVYINEKLK